MLSTDPGAWGTCVTCGDALPPRAARCPTCGASPRSANTRGSSVRVRIHRGVRVLLIVGVAVALTGVMALAIYQGPPVAVDPLTAHWFFVLGPSNSSAFAGAVTGGDYVTGNFTVVSPPGAFVLLHIYNSSSYARLLHGFPTVPAQTAGNATRGLLDFSALYTDTYYFVWTNPYAPSTGITIELYAASSYMSNIVVE